MKKALSVGAKSPLIASFGSKRYQQANLVTLLAVLEATYVVKKNILFIHIGKKSSFSHYKFEKMYLIVKVKLIN